MKKKNKLGIMFFVTMILLCLGITFLVYSITYGPVPTVTADDSILTFRGGKEQTVSASKDISITVFDKRVDFLEVGGQLYMNGNPMDELGERLKVTILYNNSNIYYIGDFIEGYQYINSNNCELFPITENINLTLKFDFTVPNQYCTCKGAYTFTFNETLRVGKETGLTLW